MLACAQLLGHQDAQAFPSELLPAKKSPACITELPFVLVEFQKISIVLFSQPIQVPLDGSTALKDIHQSHQLDFNHKLDMN